MDSSLSRAEIDVVVDLIEQVAPQSDFGPALIDAALSLRAGEGVDDVLADMPDDAREYLAEVFVGIQKQLKAMSDEVEADKKRWREQVAGRLTDSDLYYWMSQLEEWDPEHAAEYKEVATSRLMGESRADALAHLSNGAITFILNLSEKCSELRATEEHYMGRALDEIWERVKEQN